MFDEEIKVLRNKLKLVVKTFDLVLQPNASVFGLQSSN